MDNEYQHPMTVKQSSSANKKFIVPAFEEDFNNISIIKDSSAVGSMDSTNGSVCAPVPDFAFTTAVISTCLAFDNNEFIWGEKE